MTLRCGRWREIHGSAGAGAGDVGAAAGGVAGVGAGAVTLSIDEKR